MKKLLVREQAAALRAAKIFNAYELTKPYGSAIVWFSNDDFHGGWYASRPGFKVDAENVSKWFTSREEVFAWATRRYKITDWKKSPFGGNTWVSAAIIDRAVADALAKTTAEITSPV